MRLYALLFTLLVLRARAASLPDKKDIEKKLTDAVKEVLDKDQPRPENISSEQELIDQPNCVKEVENNLRKNPPVEDIPVKVVVEDVKPELRAKTEMKDDNEVVPNTELSGEMKRVEIDLENPGSPQRMEHDTQNPEHFEDSQQTVVLKAQNLNNWWKSTPQYQTLQKDLKKLKESFNKQIDNLDQSIQNVWSSHPEEGIEAINVRASIKQENSGTGTTSAPGNGGFGSGSGPFATMIQQWQESLSNFNKTVNEYFANQTAQFQGNNNTNVNGGNNWFNFGSGPFNFFNQSQPEGAQSDEPKPGFWQNIQSFFSLGQPPWGTQSDTPQPAQPNRPVIQAVQNAFQSGVNFFQPNQNKPAEPQKPDAEKPAEGSNVVPESNDNQNQKPEATPQVVQSGPIKQFIGNSPIVQGIAGAVQRLQHTIVPEKPREEEVKNAEAVKGGFFKPVVIVHKPGHGSGDGASVGTAGGTGVEAKNVPVEETAPVEETEPAEETVPVVEKDSVADEENKEVPVVPEKTE